ncbi:MAG: hypothetical protein H6728_06525 [Myxococcales bacterium]|nr:hypothetical protein [Myxococcales bacterium]
MTQILAFRLVVILLFLVVFAEASLSKVLGGGVPDWFRDQFSKSWLARLAPLPMLWWTIALVELGVAVLFVLAGLSVLIPALGAIQVWMGWGFIGAVLLFSILCFGQRVTFDFAGAANSFFYASLSAILWFIFHALK